MEPSSLLVLVLLIFILLALGLPIGFVLGGVSVIGVLSILGTRGLYLLFGTIHGQSTNEALIAVPLYVLMASILSRTKIAEDLYSAMSIWLARIKGGLAIGTILVCTVFAAMAGISSVATISMGLIAVPEMLKRGYAKQLAIGSVSAGGALGILIPPSVIMIIYGVVAEVSIGQLFMAGVGPGLLLSLLFIIYVWLRSAIDPSVAPPSAVSPPLVERLRSLKKLILPLSVVTVVLGSLYFGICTPVEAAGVGAVGAVGCALARGGLNARLLGDACMETLRITAAVMWIVFGAAAYSAVMSLAGLHLQVERLFNSLELSPWAILFLMQLTYFVLGMFLDPAGIVMLTAPVFVPIARQLGFNDVWFGVLFVINMEMAYLTPPFGFNLFIMKTVVPREIGMGDIIRSIVPFVVCQAVCLAIVAVVPEIALWLPSQMMRK